MNDQLTKFDANKFFKKKTKKLCKKDEKILKGDGDWFVVFFWIRTGL